MVHVYRGYVNGRPVSLCGGSILLSETQGRVPDCAACAVELERLAAFDAAAMLTPPAKWGFECVVHGTRKVAEDACCQLVRRP